MMPPSTEMMTTMRKMDAQQYVLMIKHQQPVKSNVPRVLSESNLSTTSTDDISEYGNDLDAMMDNPQLLLPAVPESRQETRPREEDHQAEPIALPVFQRRSILKPYIAEDIPIRGKGWRNLPKPDLKNIPKSQCSLGRPKSRDICRVSFKWVEFRCHDQCCGDNPSVSIGTPISLDWQYEDMDPIDLDLYESQRESSRRNLRQMMMNYFQRRTLLSYRYGISDNELDEAAKAADKIRNQRSITRALLPTFLIEDLVTSAARKTKRALAKKDTRSIPQHPREMAPPPISMPPPPQEELCI